ncbi:MAG: hypothetical protein HQK59_12725 [Deltaproteobacteria bacterium]|nr:hypothetical protein [Deltaproteobacteria bacterium]
MMILPANESNEQPLGKPISSVEDSVAGPARRPSAVLIGLVKLIQTAVDKGAVSIEEVHSSIANGPFRILNKISVIAPVSRCVQEVQNKTIEGVYGIIRVINQGAGAMAKTLLQVQDKIRD